MLASRVLRLSAAKRTTGLVGIDVVPDARTQCVSWYKKTLEKVKVFHPESEYRKSVEATSKYRMGIMEAHTDEQYAQIEEEIDCGQIEELLIQVKDEFDLIDTLKDTPFNAPAEDTWKPSQETADKA